MEIPYDSSHERQFFYQNIQAFYNSKNLGLDAAQAPTDLFALYSEVRKLAFILVIILG